MTALLAYIPFLHPLNAVQNWWYLLVIPLAFGISVIHKAIRMADLDDHYWRQVAVMTTQIVVAMIALAVALAVLVQMIIPRLPIE